MPTFCPLGMLWRIVAIWLDKYSQHLSAFRDARGSSIVCTSRRHEDHEASFVQEISSRASCLRDERALGVARSLLKEGLEADPRPEVHSRPGADAVRDHEIEAEECGGNPDAAADALREVLIGELLPFVVHGADVHEHADAKFGDVEWRGERRTDFGCAGHERVADERAGAEAAQVRHPAEHRLQIWRQRDV